MIAYIDGFNLYFGLKSKGWRRYYWLNLQQLVENLLRPDQQLMQTKYFTARVAAPADKQIRQATYLEALQTLPNLTIFYGKYQLNRKRCPHCGAEDFLPTEKMSDVNLAVELMTDAFQDRFDTAFLISADSDLTGPVLAVQRLFPAKRIVVAFPPDRFSAELKNTAQASLVIGRGPIAHSQFPPQVARADGFLLNRPASWH